MNSIADPANPVTPSSAHPVDSVSATAGGFLRALGLERDALTQPWISITSLSSGAWINISPPYGTPVERLDLIGEAAQVLGADTTAVRYLPSGSAEMSIVEVTGDWAECPISVTTVVATTDLVDIETVRAVAATINGAGETGAYRVDDSFDADEFDTEERLLDARMDSARDGAE